MIIYFYMKSSFKIKHAFGGKRVNRGIAHCAQALRQLAPVAEDAGVVLLMETLCAQAHPDYQADHSAFARQRGDHARRAHEHQRTGRFGQLGDSVSAGLAQHGAQLLFFVQASLLP